MNAASLNTYYVLLGNNHRNLCFSLRLLSPLKMLYEPSCNELKMIPLNQFERKFFLMNYILNTQLNKSNKLEMDQFLFYSLDYITTGTLYP